MKTVNPNKRIVLDGLNASEYEHPQDKTTLEALKSIPVLPKLIEFVQVPYNIVTRFGMLSSNVHVTERQYPTLYKILRKACEIMEVPEPLLYVSSDSSFGANAFTACPDSPIILIGESLLDKLHEDEIMFVIGHELAHIKSEHIVYSELGELVSTGVLKILASTVPGLNLIYTPVEIALNYALYAWMRVAEYTCDRGGFLACQNYEASCRALMKMAGYSKTYANELSLEEFFVQAMAFEDIGDTAPGKVGKILLSFGRTHPFTVSRARELMRFRDSGDYDRILRREMRILELPSGEEKATPAPKGWKFKNPFKKIATLLSTTSKKSSK